MPQINGYIANFTPANYATGETALEGMLDCSLGVNPYGCSAAVTAALQGFDMSHEASAYPHTDGLKEAIVRYWTPWATLTAVRIVYGNGSMDLLADINRLFLYPGAKVFGVMPGFSAYSDDVRMCGASYTGFTLTSALSESETIDGILAGIRQEKPHMICLENPNNPTGYAFTLAGVERVVSLAEEMDIPILVDEAYGDFLPQSQSAICLSSKYKSLVVSRTFSKGFGLAGLRVGYAVADTYITENLQKISCLFNANVLGRRAAEAALGDMRFMEETVASVRRGKRAILGAMHNIFTYPTAETTPIMTLCTGRDVDLFEHLLRFGVFAVPGAGFEGLSRRNVRLILHRDIDELAARLTAADSALA